MMFSQAAQIPFRLSLHAFGLRVFGLSAVSRGGHESVVQRFRYQRTYIRERILNVKIAFTPLGPTVLGLHRSPPAEPSKRQIESTTSDAAGTDATPTQTQTGTSGLAPLQYKNSD